MRRTISIISLVFKLCFCTIQYIWIRLLSEYLVLITSRELSDAAGPGCTMIIYSNLRESLDCNCRVCAFSCKVCASEDASDQMKDPVEKPMRAVCSFRALVYDSQGCTSSTNAPPGTRVTWTSSNNRLKPASPPFKWIYLDTENLIACNYQPPTRYDTGG